MQQNERHEAVADLVRSMTKAEKRSFKLYAGRIATGDSAKFVALFDCIDQMECYDQQRILARCPTITKQQLPNLKAHLYRQILISLRLTSVQHSAQLELTEQIDFARLLFDKGLYGQSSKMLDRATRLAEQTEQYAALLEITELAKQVNVLNVSSMMTQVAESVNRQADDMLGRIATVNRLSKLSLRLYDLHQQLGFVRSQKDMDLLNDYFKPKLDVYKQLDLSFTERFYYYQAMAWYHYLKHNLALSYRYAIYWIDLFNSRPQMKEVMYDSYLRGYAQVLEGMFLMRSYDRFVDALTRFETESTELGKVNENATMIAQQIIFTGKLNKCLLEGSYKEGLWLTKSIDSYLKRYAGHLSAHEKMMLDYKIASLYFGDGNFQKCRTFLSEIIAVKDPRIRRDLQCYARMLNLIALAESGEDFNLDYQIRSVYSFIVKMRDMSEMKQVVFSFFKKIGSAGVFDLRGELKTLYEQMKPYETHPYERRTFYYIDLLSWLESRITGRSMGQIVREKFERTQRQTAERRHKSNRSK